MTNIFYQSLRGPTVLNLIYFSKSGGGGIAPPPAPSPARALNNNDVVFVVDLKFCYET